MNRELKDIEAKLNRTNYRAGTNRRFFFLPERNKDRKEKKKKKKRTDKWRERLLLTATKNSSKT